MDPTNVKLKAIHRAQPFAKAGCCHSSQDMQIEINKASKATILSRVLEDMLSGWPGVSGANYESELRERCAQATSWIITVNVIICDMTNPLRPTYGDVA